MMDYEVRTAEMWPEADYELRASPDGLALEGYAAVFNVPSLPMAFPGIAGGRRFREVIHPGAFAESLVGTPDVTLRYQHNLLTLPLGRTTAGTLSLVEDDHGLRTRADLPDNEWGHPVRDAIVRRDITGMSFRFRQVEEKWEQDGSNRVRHLHRVELGPEVSITDYPAYPDTSVMVRHLAEAAEVDVDELAQAVRALCEADEITPAEHSLIQEAIRAKYHGEGRHVPSTLAKRYARLGAS